MDGSARTQVVAGPLGLYAADYAEALTGRGYSSYAVRLRLWQLDHLSRWLGEQGLAAHDLTGEQARRFLAERRDRGYRSWVSAHSLTLPLGYLRDVGAAPAAELLHDPERDLVERYRRYLVAERGLAEATIKDYLRTARLFLSRHAPAISTTGTVVVDWLDAGRVTTFLVRECAYRNVSSAQYLVAGLRSLLRYLHVQGHLSIDLARVVPGVAGRRGSTLPRGVPASRVAALLASCDRNRAVGLRDYAIVLTLARLGLRCAELAALTVDDVDWHRGEITVRGKRNVVDRMPLPADVGEALVDYLINGRPRTSSRELFLRVRAPRQAMAPCAVGAVVHDASIRAGFPKLITAHQLRHSLGTDLLRAGASLPEVAQVLRQRHLSATVIYAKVDHAALRELVTPWPGASA